MTPPDPFHARLSTKSIAIMQLIAAGHSYDELLASDPSFSARDVSDAAAEVLAVMGDDTEPPATLPKQRYTRDNEPWTAQEEQRLRQLIDEGHTVARIAGRLERNRGAIRARIVALNLVNHLDPAEQSRLHRVMTREGEGAE